MQWKMFEAERTKRSQDLWKMHDVWKVESSLMWLKMRIYGWVECKG